MGNHSLQTRQFQCQCMLLSTSVREYSARQLRTTMPDQTRRILNGIREHQQNQSAPSTTAAKLSRPVLFPRITASAHNSPKFRRRYSQQQSDTDSSSQGSSVDKEAVLKVFQQSLAQVSDTPLVESRLERRRSSPDLTHLPTSFNLSAYAQESSSLFPESQPILPKNSLLAKMVGGGRHKSFLSSLAGTQPCTDSSSSPSSSLQPSSGMPADVSSTSQQVANASAVGSASGVKNCPGGLAPRSMCASDTSSPVDSVDAQSSSSGPGLLARTRQFGAWLSSAVDSEKVDVTKKDVNVFAPTTF